MDLNRLLEGIKAGKRYILKEVAPSANLYRTEDHAGDP